MKKVTDLKEGEVIYCSTEEQANAICKLMHEAGLRWCSGKSYLEMNEFSSYGEGTCYEPASGSYCSNDYFEGRGYTIHEAEDFLEKDLLKEAIERGFVKGAKFISPEIIDRDKKEQVVETEPYFYHEENIAVRNEEGVIYFEGEWATLIEDTKEKEMEDREIIGYKLIKPEYEKAAARIAFSIDTDTLSVFNVPVRHNFGKNSIAERKFKEAGVLDLWFEPVYEESFKEGDWVKLKDKRGEDWNSEGMMDYLKGAVIQLRSEWKNERFWIDGGGRDWSIDVKDIERKATPEEILEAKRTKLPTINGYKGESVNGNLKWGCFEISKENVYHLIRLKLKSFTIEASDETAEVTEEQFNQIKKYL